MFEMRLGEERGARLGDRILRRIETMATRFADLILTVHEPSRRELAARGVPREKILVVMNTVDKRHLPSADGARADEGFRVVYQGTITPPYGLHLLVEAVSEISDELPETRVEIYGDGDSLPEIRSLVQARDLQDRVYLSGGFLPHLEVLERIRSTSVGVICNLPIPLNRFALSEKLFEYVVLGIPVVSADLPTIREYFDDSEVLFFRAGDAHALADALLQARREPEAALQRAAAALERYEQYRWPAHARSYTPQLLTAVCAASGGGCGSGSGSPTGSPPRYVCAASRPTNTRSSRGCWRGRSRHPASAGFPSSPGAPFACCRAWSDAAAPGSGPHLPERSSRAS